MGIDLTAAGSPPGGTAPNDHVSVFRQGAASPYLDSMSNIVVAGGGLQVARALADVNARLARLNLGLANPTFYPEVYGAKFDGVTDDTAAWAALIQALWGSPIGGTIELPIGVSLCSEGVIKLPPHGSIMGKGHASVLRVFGAAGSGLANSYFIDMSADGPTISPTGYNTLSDFKIEGGVSGGGSHPLRMFFNAHSVIHNVWGDSFNAGLLHAVQLWDTRIVHLQGDYTGTAQGSKAVWFQNSGATSGTSQGNDNGNQNFVISTRLEGFYGEALCIEQGPGNTAPPNGYYVHDFKAETQNIVSSPIVYIGVGVTQCSFTDFYISLDYFYNANGNNSVSFYGPATAVNCVENHGQGFNYFGQFRLYQESAGLCAIPFLHAATGPDHIEDITFTGGGLTAPTANCIISLAVGAVRPIITGFLASLPAIPTIVGYNAPITAAATALPTDTFLTVDASAGAFTLSLPPPRLCIGHTLTIVKLDASANAVTVTSSDGTPINSRTSIKLVQGNATIVLQSKDDGRVIVSSGAYGFGQTQYFTMDSNGQQIVIQGETTPAMQLLVGYDTTNDYALFQAVHQGVDYKLIFFNKAGGKIGFGTLPGPYADQATAASNGVVQGQLFMLGSSAATAPVVQKT